MIYVTFKGVEYELPYDNDTLQLNKTIDSTFDNGYFETTPLEASSGLDFSRKIPRGLLVRVEYDEEVFTFRTGETNMDKISYGTNAKYVHRVSLISLSKDLTKKTLENMTLTQPKGDFAIYSRSVNRLDDTVKGSVTGITPLVYTLTGDPIINVSYDIPFINMINSNTAKINELAIVSLEEYSITLSVTIWHKDSVLSKSVRVDVDYGVNEIFSQQYTIPKSKWFKALRNVKTFTFKYTPTATNSFSVDVVNMLQGDIYIEDVSISITAIETLDIPIRTYAQLVDKILRNTDYVLSPKSRARLNLTAPEGKYEELMLYDALEKTASEQGALVRVGDNILERLWRITTPVTQDIEGAEFYNFNPYDYSIGTILKVGSKYYENVEGIRIFREINYEFFDNPNIVEIVGETDRTEIAEYEDYVSALELNTKNIIKPIRYSPFKNGWGTLRGLEGIGQMTTDNIGFLTEDNQEKIISVKVKGYKMRNVDSTKVWASSTVDITERVVEKKQWDTFPSQADYSVLGKETYMKNNTLYYIQGDNKIYGMSYYGETKNRLIGDATVTRALYETILAQMSNTEGERIYGDYTYDDPGQAGDLLIQMQVTYENQTESRARIYKSDQTGFEQDYVKYINESSNVNETNALGDYAQLLVNRLGGTKIIVEGTVESLSQLANVGDMNAQGQVYTVISIKPSGNRTKYTITLVNDFNVISSYIGVNSRHRVEEISSDSTTNRTLRYTSKVIFTDTLKSFTTRLIKQSDIFKHLLGNTLTGLNYGYLESYLSNEEVKKIHMSVDTDSKGTTLEIKWNLYDNYSAGLKRYAYTNLSDTVYMNNEVPYTDLYGKVTDILFGIYDNHLGTLDMNAYPEASANNGNEVFVFVNDVIDKDAGEILSGLVEIPFLSESSKIRVYNGFAKYNALKGQTNRIGTVALEYVPLIKDQKIDLTRARDVTLTGVIDFNNLSFSFTNYVPIKGIAWYHKDTLDLVLAYVEDIAAATNTIRLPYYIEDGLSGGGLNISINIISTYDLGGISLGHSVGQSLNIQTGDLSYETSHVESQDEFSGLLTLNYGLDNTINVLIKTPYNVITSDIDYVTTHTIHNDFFDDIILNYSAQENRYVAVGVTQIVIVSDIDYVQSSTEHSDNVVLVGIEYEVIATPTALKNAVNVIQSTINYDTTVYKTEYDWVLGGTSPTTGQTCDISTDVGNVRCDEVCNFVDTDTFLSQSDQSTTPTCDDNVQKITCVDNGMGYTCTTSIGTLSFANCEICSGTESEA